jgi:hypothetical protein
MDHRPMTWRLRAALALPTLFAIALCSATQAFAVEDAGPSIYDYIAAHIDPATGQLSPEGAVLPDEPSARRYSRIRWVPGALEGLGTRHMQWDGSEKASRAARLLELIAVTDETSSGNATAEAALYELLRVDDVVTFYSDALDLAAARTRNVEPKLHELARRLAMTSRDRGPVKFGIAMLGSMGDERDVDVLRTLALHDEFGLYAAEALAEIAPDRQAALYDMARKLRGWGRIEAVARMVATSDPVLRRWLLTDGFRNSINPQYLAFQCASIADLAGALDDARQARTADAALLVGAADILQALVKPGPGPGFDNYPEAPRAADAFLHLIEKRRDSVSFLLAAHALREYASAYGPASSSAAEWTPLQLKDTVRRANRIVADPSWRQRVTAAIAQNRGDLTLAADAATLLKIDTFDLHVRALSKQPANAQRWSLAFAAASPERVPRLITLAEKNFGRGSASTRAADARAHPPGTLEAVLQGIASYPGSGMKLVESSLSDRDNRVRRAAVETLTRWGSSYLRDASVRTALDDAARTEADEALKARMVALLNLSALP